MMSNLGLSVSPSFDIFNRGVEICPEIGAGFRLFSPRLLANFAHQLFELLVGRLVVR